MAQVGRRPTPTNILDLRGSRWSKTRTAQKQEYHSCILLPTAPDWFQEKAQVLWQHIGEEIETLGILTPLILALLTRYCVALVQWEEAQILLSQEGTLCETDKGYKYIHPCVRLVRDLGQELLRLEQELGMTPGSIKSLGIQPKKDIPHGTKASKKARFFHKKT